MWIIDNAVYSFFLEPLKLCPNEINRFRRVYRRMIVHNLERDTRPLRQCDAYGAIFSAGGRNHERLFIV